VALGAVLLAAAAVAFGSVHARAHVVGASGITTTTPVQVVGTGFRAHARYVVSVVPGTGSCTHRVTRRTPPAAKGGSLRAVVSAPAGGWCPDTSYVGRITRASHPARRLATFRFHVLALPPGTVSGTVFVVGCIGPAAAAATVPCHPPRPLQGAVLDFSDAKGKIVAEVTSDANGQFGANLAPGTYTLTPQPDAGMTTPSPQTVTVASQQHVTGITVTYRMLGIAPAP
jgi:hypothetical protein